MKNRVTPKQNALLKELSSGPKTRKDLAAALLTSTHSVAKLLKRLRDAELIHSSKLQGARRNVHVYELVVPYPEMNLIVSTYKGGGIGRMVSDEEVLYAAILRNAGLTGQGIGEIYLKKYPERTQNGIKNIVLKARRQGLCR